MNLVCTDCNVTFTDVFRLRKHQRSHVRPKAHVCGICARGFTLKSELRTHKHLVHKGKKPFACTRCDKSFTQKQTLLKHRMVRHGEENFDCEDLKPLTCTQCGESFSLLRLLIKHRRIHDGVAKPTIQYDDLKTRLLASLLNEGDTVQKKRIVSVPSLEDTQREEALPMRRFQRGARVIRARRRAASMKLQG